jgi:KaiC/GvpD/RAD55 family RecA-like ATPase
LIKELTPMDLIEERFPSGTTVLIVGPPGSGKTILSQQLIFKVLKRGNSAIFVGTKSQKDLIKSQKKLFNWNIGPYINKNQFAVVEIGDVADPTELNISLTQAIGECEEPLSLVGVDSLTVLMVGMEERKTMKFTEALSRKLQDQKVSLLLLATPTKETEDFLTKMKSLVSSVIEIKLEERGTIRRYMRIFKFSERKHSTQWVPFEISDRGIQFPSSLVRLPHSRTLFLPKGILIEEVSTPYEKFEQLTERITREKMSCILETRFITEQGIMLFSKGERMKSMLIGKDGKKICSPQTLETYLRSREGSLSVYSIPPELIPFVMSYLEDQVLFRNLSSEQIKFDDIMENLSESEFTGCVLMRSDEEQGMIFIDEGDVIDAYFENAHLYRSEEALSAFEKATSQGNFQIDIFYSPKTKKEPETNLKNREIEETLVEGALSPEFIPTKGHTVRGALINATLRYIQEQNKMEWSSSAYYPRPLRDIAISKVEAEILQLKTMNDPHVKRDTYKLRRSYRDQDWYPADEYWDIVYAVTRMLQFNWSYDNHDQYEEGWRKLSQAYFELGKTVPGYVGFTRHQFRKDLWDTYFITEIKKWRTMGSFTELESKKEDKRLILIFKKDVEPPPRRKGMLWALLEGLGLSKFSIHLEGESYIISFG